MESTWRDATELIPGGAKAAGISGAPSLDFGRNSCLFAWRDEASLAMLLPSPRPRSVVIELFCALPLELHEWVPPAWRDQADLGPNTPQCSCLSEGEQRLGASPTKHSSPVFDTRAKSGLTKRNKEGIHGFTPELHATRRGCSILNTPTSWREAQTMPHFARLSASRRRCSRKSAEGGHNAGRTRERANCDAAPPDK